MFLRPRINSILCVRCCASEADLNIAQTAWGDSGVYYCSVVSSQDLSGNSEAYTELIVLGKLVSMALTSSLISPTHKHTRTVCLLSFFSSCLLISTKLYTRYNQKKCQMKILVGVLQVKSVQGLWLCP